MSIASAIGQLAAMGVATFDVIVPPNPHVAQTLRDCLHGLANVTLRPPFGHPQLLQRMRDCDLVLSDSGGIQEEAPVLGIPLLILRDKTERPEGIATGNMRLVGTDAARIVDEVCRLLTDPLAYSTMCKKALPYGDGRAAPRIAAIIEQWLNASRLPGANPLRYGSL